MTDSTILMIGDSHIYALRDAVKRLESLPAGVKKIEALRLMPEKGDKKGVGDITFAEAVERARQLSGTDMLVTALRGNQYNTIGLMQHPVPFDFTLPHASPVMQGSAEIIPLIQMRQYFSQAIRSGYGKMLAKLRQHARVPVICLGPPAPKNDEAHIKRGAETFFKAAGIAEIGVTPAPTRLKLWSLQEEAVSRFCEENGLFYLANPPATHDANGYLDRKYYAKDATHANAEYGLLVIGQVAELAASYRTLKIELKSGEIRT